MATKKIENKNPADLNRVEWGSPQHLGLLGLRKAAADDELQYHGWTLDDMTAAGPQVTETYLKERLRQQVCVLEGGPPKISEFAPPMWEPVVTVSE